MAIEDDFSIGSFKTIPRRFSFSLSKNSSIRHSTKELIYSSLAQVILNEAVDDNLSLDLTFKNNNTSDNSITSNRRATRFLSTSNEYSGSPMLESAEVAEIPLAHE